jgi:hypothetical protein
MCLRQFVVIGSFQAWAPSDRERPERRVSITPEGAHLFTDDADNVGVLVKFLKNGAWFEAKRSEFERATRIFEDSLEKAAEAC